MAEQTGDHRWLAMGGGPHHHGDFDMGPQLDQAELADLREGALAARPGRGAGEGGRVGLRVGDVEDRAVEPHQPQAAVERPRRLRPGQGTNDLEEQVPHRRHAQPLTGDAEAGAVRRLLAFAEPPGGLEDLSDRQIGQQPHGQHHPQDDLVRQPTAARIDPAGGRERLLNVLGADHLFESRQSIQNPARVIGRQRAMSLWHASHSLLGALLVGKPKVTGGCDLRLFQRYWG